MKKILTLATLILGVLTCSAQAQSSSYPTRSVRAVLPYSVGGGPDTVARMIGEQLSTAWKQPFIVENKPGANGWLALGEVKRSAADGYSIAIVDNTHMTLHPHLYKKMPFDPARDFVAAAPIYSTHFFIVVSANSPWRNVGDLIGAAHKANGHLTYGTWGIGSVAHLGSTILQQRTQMSMTHIPFKDLSQLYAAVANGDVDWAFGTAATVQNLYQAKRVKFLALAAPARLAAYPDVPTIAQAGGPQDFELKTWVAAFAPRGTPQAVIESLNTAIAAALRTPAIKQRFETFGFNAWSVDAPGLARAVNEDSAHFGQIVQKANIALD
ncbi:extra-cytoplasmic solute receptor family protein 56 [Advenella kashmirensis WT001]|uniref:Extra-cytoplasmic solute receptor family protein 56 n=1 Tax=Advenella kashmirensis (strain DSM 17095 / LMG 22695 / WT001) TaxID=1036672 RepID=I3UA55_ADVKW|nr:tripartite tricarboxylate transporter substrate binding protein [Advenella kashmirensis]AFK61893.1 extra-cytoplasmic solute receptor family protein 56 [Advenella kashmirensis WT001]